MNIAEHNCLRDTLEPQGYVRLSHIMHGKQKILHYEWVEVAHDSSGTESG